jgi:hypothetical protein
VSRFSSLREFKFPPKKWFSSFTTNTVERRRQQFEQYLQELVGVPWSILGNVFVPPRKSSCGVIPSSYPCNPVRWKSTSFWKSRRICTEQVGLRIMRIPWVFPWVLSVLSPFLFGCEKERLVAAVRRRPD